MFIQSAGGEVIEVPALPDIFRLNIPAIEVALESHMKGVIINPPNNPSGVVYPREDLNALSELLRQKGQTLRHTPTGKGGKRTYRSTPKRCKACPCKVLCGANEKRQRIFTSHIWQEYLNIVEQPCKIECGRQIYAMRKQTIERVFADAKEKHANWIGGKAWSMWFR